MASAWGARWGGCGSVSRLGPACELYCRDSENDRVWYRLTATGDELEPVTCGSLTAPIWIMDVHEW